MGASVFWFPSDRRAGEADTLFDPFWRHQFFLHVMGVPNKKTGQWVSSFGFSRIRLKEEVASKHPHVGLLQKHRGPKIVAFPFGLHPNRAKRRARQVARTRNPTSPEPHPSVAHQHLRAALQSLQASWGTEW